MIMDTFTLNIYTREPIGFREYCSDIVFYAEVRGGVRILSYNVESYGEGEKGKDALRDSIIAMIPEVFENWPEGKLIMGPDNREILETELCRALKDLGISAEPDIRNISLVEGQMDNYMAVCGEALDRQMNPQVSTDGLEEEKHGPMTSFSLNYYSHGMMRGTSSSYGERIDWNRDGSITLTDSGTGGGKETRSVYNIRPETAQKLRDYVEETHLAALSKKDIPLPQVFDNFTSVSISMSFDDSVLGGSSYEYCTINCGPAHMTFRDIENKLSEILNECRETGECTLSEEKAVNNGLTGVIGFMGLGSVTPPQPAQKTAEPTVTQSAEPVDLEPPKPGCWTCTKCGFNENMGKFCANCGYPRNS